jgi:hypothetical protein
LRQTKQGVDRSDSRSSQQVTLYAEG